jgi:N-acetylglucosamine kinase-like BadF-type ATPase
MLSQLITGEIEIVGDHEIALEAAFQGGPGAIVIAGTGSIAYARNAAGQAARAGGWGFAISDEGSGHWIGRAALAAALRACDERGRDNPANIPLLAAIMQFWKVQTHEELVLRGNASPDFAALLPTILSLADAGDVLAGEVLSRGALELAAIAKVAMRGLFADNDVVPVAMSGGVFSSSATVRKIFYNNLRSDYPHAAVADRIVDPVQGALSLARRR